MVVFGHRGGSAYLLHFKDYPREGVGCENGFWGGCSGMSHNSRVCHLCVTFVVQCSHDIGSSDLILRIT